MRLALLLLLVPLALAVTSPLTQPQYTWDLDGSSLGLPWYAVSQWEVDVCTQGLTTLYGYDAGSSEVESLNLQTPLYMDAATILAQFREKGGLTYYEVGWYLQPFTRAVDARVVVYNSNGLEHVVPRGTGQASPAQAFDGYASFFLPCDPHVFTGCLPFGGRLTRARLEWSTEGGAAQYLVATFTNATGVEE